MIAANIANIDHGANRFSKVDAGIPAPSIEEAATLLNINKSTVSEAKSVLRQQPPALIATKKTGGKSSPTSLKDGRGEVGQYESRHTNRFGT